jgi:hypothetical protein
MTLSGTMTWSHLSTEDTSSAVAINFRSDQGVRARAELRQEGASVVARVSFEGTDEHQTRATCLHVAATIFDAMVVRASLSARPPDLHLVASVVFCPKGAAWLELTGADARVVLVAAFGDAYAEAAP